MSGTGAPLGFEGDCCIYISNRDSWGVESAVSDEVVIRLMMRLLIQDVDFIETKP